MLLFSTTGYWAPTAGLTSGSVWALAFFYPSEIEWVPCWVPLPSSSWGFHGAYVILIGIWIALVRVDRYTYNGSYPFVVAYRVSFSCSICKY